MELIRAYADKVASYLPASTRQDAADELFDGLCEQYEENGELSEKAETAFLQAQPHPIKMATQLSESDNLYLIGPAYYLSFIEAIKVAAIVIAVIHLGLFGIAAWGSDNLIRAALKTITNFPGVYLNAVLIIGLIFVVIEKTGERASWLDKWNIQELKALIKHQKISKLGALFELNIVAFAFLWFSGVVELPPVVRHDGVWLTDLSFQLPNAVLTLVLGILAYDILVAVFKLIRGYWSSLLRVASLVSNAIWIALLSWAVSRDVLVSSEALANLTNAGDVLAAVNLGVQVSLIIAIVIITWDAITQVYQMAKR